MAESNDYILLKGQNAIEGIPEMQPAYISLPMITGFEVGLL